MKDQKHIRTIMVFSTLILFFGGMSISAKAQIFSQDLTLHETTSGSGMMGRGGSSVASTTYFSKNAMRITSQNGNDTIVQFNSGKITIIDNKKKTYSETTFKELQEMLSKMTSEMGKNQEQMEAMKKMMGGTGDGSVSVTKEGPGESIAGYATEKYLVKGPMDMEIWAAPDLKIPVSYYDVMKLQVPQNPLFDMRKMYDEMKKIDGMTLKTVTTVHMMNMEAKTARLVTSVDKGSIPASTFEVPSGYKLVPLSLK